MLEGIQRAAIVSDDSGHKYLIPYDLKDGFYKKLSDESFTDSGKFDDLFGKYRMDGSTEVYGIFKTKWFISSEL
jgi:hypothetical protein